LRKRKINSSKRALSKMMERISNCPTIDGRLKNSSDFKDVLTSMLVLLLVGGSPLFLFMAGHSSRGDE
jgi:hypothetical protein